MNSSESNAASVSTSNTGFPSRGDTNRGRGKGRGGGDVAPGARSRGQRGRGRGRGGNSNLRPTTQLSSSNSEALPGVATAPHGEAKQTPDEDESITAGDTTADGEVCFICAEIIKFHSIAPCNHKTCHICGLRMRALYKTKDCPHCRTPAPFVVFTDDSTKRYEDYSDTDITSFDSNIGIRYTNEEIVGDTVVLLRYNCPAGDCIFAGLGWPDLHRHVRSVHHRKMCDLCTRNKKVFTHEHDLFTDKELEKHMRYGDDQPGAVDQTGFKGHPLCSFCGQRFYDDDKLYEHCRDKHERCFLCDRRDSRQPHYYLDYNALDQHFRTDHFPCMDRECQEKKFVVFESELDLKAHQLSEHGTSLSKDVRKDARIVDMAGFDFRQTYQQERRGGGAANGRDGRAGRGRGRDPNAGPSTQSSAQPLRRDELAFQRQLAIHSAQSVSNRTFGGHLSAPSNSPTPSSRRVGTPSLSSASQAVQATPTSTASVLPDPSVSDPASLPAPERARLVRHGAVIERAANLLGNDSTKMVTFRGYISSYNTGKFTAPHLIDAFFSLFSDTSSNALGTLVREVAELFEEKSQADALRKAWQDWRAINEDYPSLPGLGGMHGTTTSSSGWASAATVSPTTLAAAPSQKHSTRVLRLKNSTRRGSGSSTSSTNTLPSTQGRRDPVTSAFPALPATSKSASSTGSRPSWIGSSNNVTPSVNSRPSGIPSRSGNNEDAFPALPAAPKPLSTIYGYGTGSVRRDFADRSTGFAWGTDSPSATTSNNVSELEDDAGPEKGGKKKKGNKGKKVLVQWG